MSKSGGDVGRRDELAGFLQARRAELQPEDVGLRRQPRRRVRGLRRHEVADLAAVSLTWYTWLEQGRDIHASAQAIDSLCRALKLDNDAWRHVRRLAGVPVIEPQPTPPEPSPILSTMVDVLGPIPAFLTIGPLELVAWNRAYTTLWGDPGLLPRDRRNLIWLVAQGGVRDRVHDWEALLQDLTFGLRAELGKRPGDPHFRDVIRDLNESCPEFFRLWHLYKVRHSGHFDVTIVDHPEVGPISVRPVHLRCLEEPAAVLCVQRPADDESKAKLDALHYGLVHKSASLAG